MIRTIFNRHYILAYCFSPATACFFNRHAVDCQTLIKHCSININPQLDGTRKFSNRGMLKNIDPINLTLSILTDFMVFRFSQSHGRVGYFLWAPSAKRQFFLNPGGNFAAFFRNKLFGFRRNFKIHGITSFYFFSSKAWVYYYYMLFMQPIQGK